MITRAIKKKSFYKHIKDELNQELTAWYVLLRTEWVLILVLIAVLFGLATYAKPFPPKEVTLIVGQKGGSFDYLGQHFRTFFKDHGVELKIFYTDGAQQSLEELVKQPNMQAAFVLGGSANPIEVRDIVSLGSIEYEPLWFFYRGAEYNADDVFEYFSKLRVNIGSPGSGTQRIVREIVKMRGGFLNSKGIFEYRNAVATDKLLSGELDAAIMIEGFNSPNVQRLLTDPQIRLFDFTLAAALVKQLPYLDVVTIPRGALNFRTIYPHKDIRMVATTMTLLVEKDMHPALQLLFLMAADALGDSRDLFFAKPDEFPSYTDHTVPLSPIAKEYFRFGSPYGLKFFPFWIVSFFERMWFLLLAIIAVGYPLYRLLPNYRNIHSKIEITGAYQNIREAEDLVRAATSSEALQSEILKLDQIEKDLTEMWIPIDNMSSYYSLVSALSTVQKLARERLEKLTRV
jgi:TRAP-type uncharacterized transport system substrate-binding protein